MRRRHFPRSRSARVRWWTLPLLLVAVAFVVMGVLWARGPSGTTPAPAPLGLPAAPGSGDGAGRLAVDGAPATTDAAKPATPPGTEPMLGGFSPVRVLVLNEGAGNFTVELCTLTTQSVLIRWYAIDSPTQLVTQQTVTVPSGKGTFPLKKDLVPSAQTVGPSGGTIGQEIGPGETGNCP